VIIPFEKLLSVKENKYVFTKALMRAVDKIGNIKDYPEEHVNWKVVPIIIKLVMDGKVKYNNMENPEEDKSYKSENILK
jgi:hypothetical protein